MFRIENDSKGANTARTVRFTEKLFKQLNHLAAQNNISFNSLVLQCCKYALANYDEAASDIDNTLFK